MQWIAISISIVALFISLYALWLTHLAPFDLSVSFGTPCQSLYKITPDFSGDKDSRVWWIPSFDFGLSFYNSGNRVGQILDLRIKALLHQSQRKEEFFFYPKWIVKYPEFNAHMTDRGTWIGCAIDRDWYPIVLPGKSSVHVHLVLEGPRWDAPLSGALDLSVEVLSTQIPNWVTLQRFGHFLSEDMFEDRSTYTPHDDRLDKK